MISGFSEREVRMFEKMPLSPAQYNARSWKAIPVFEWASPWIFFARAAAGAGFTRPSMSKHVECATEAWEEFAQVTLSKTVETGYTPMNIAKNGTARLLTKLARSHRHASQLGPAIWQIDE